MRKSQERSIGTMISTVCFLGLSLVFFLHASELYDAGYGAKGVALGLCALACFAEAAIYYSESRFIHAEVLAMKKTDGRTSCRMPAFFCHP